jgi:hypothetical protein
MSLSFSPFSIMIRSERSVVVGLGHSLLDG